MHSDGMYGFITTIHFQNEFINCMKVEDEEMNSQMQKFIWFHQIAKDNRKQLFFFVSQFLLISLIDFIHGRHPGHGRHLDHPSKYRVLIFIVYVQRNCIVQ